MAERHTSDYRPSEERRTRAGLMQVFVLAGIVLFLFLVGYFLAYGPLERQEAAYPPAGRNLDLENKAAPPPQPKTP
jgi:hypothetical protein